MADSRPRRVNAGRNIGKLINQELGVDDFYKTAYGGFEEGSEDEEYKSEESDEDVIDSDFDVDESTWNADEGENEKELEEKKKKKQWIKPYKPKTPAEQSSRKPSKPPKPKKPKTVVLTSTDIAYADESKQRSLRKSTIEVSEEFKRRFLEEQDLRRKKMKYSYSRKPKERKLTQKELLAEAKRTEIENLASLEAYARLEAEKKKVKEKKSVYQGPVVRFHSIAMPLIEELPSSASGGSDESAAKDIEPNSHQMALESNRETEGGGNKLNVPGEARKEGEQSQQQKANTSNKMYCRNFLIFTDTKNFPSAFFPSSKPQRPRKRFCPYTGLPAKYIDPLTGTPYATAQAFKIIRNRYVSEGEQRCEKRLLQLSSWLEEKKRKKKEGRPY